MDDLLDQSKFEDGRIWLKTVAFSSVADFQIKSKPK